MFDTSSFFLFLSASVLLILAPGPDIIFTLTQSITRGKKAGVMTALGLAVGNSVHTVGAALGLSIIFKTSIIAFNLFKIFGVCYLLYLAFQAIKHRNDPATIKEGPGITSGSSLFFKGFLMNVLNPKVAIFFLAFLPQFVNSQSGNVTLQILILGCIFIVLVALIFGSIGYFAGSFRIFLEKSSFSRYLNVSSAVIFIALGIKLAFSRQ